MEFHGSARGQQGGGHLGTIGLTGALLNKGDDSAGVGDDGFELDGVDEGFGEGGAFERGVVEAVDVVPD